MSSNPWGSFQHKWKGKTIHVPAYMNNVARYSTDRFWDWLTCVKEVYSNYIELTLEHVGEFEEYKRKK